MFDQDLDQTYTYTCSLAWLWAWTDHVHILQIHVLRKFSLMNSSSEPTTRASKVKHREAPFKLYLQLASLALHTRTYVPSH